ncbi:uncharacterized protein LOC143452826 isoform X1 [Clavelina lepadiformis]|uniref:uncharacterized protein LOC143452826 isoform X1 n=1 Tax=Clavelina lepadiformis TaxID=159417 RepID=UPI004041D6B1
MRVLVFMIILGHTWIGRSDLIVGDDVWEDNDEYSDEVLRQMVGAYDDEDNQFGSGTATETLGPRSFYKEEILGQELQPGECILHMNVTDLVFVVDVGKNFPALAVSNVQSFIMDTLKVMELDTDKTRVAVTAVGFGLSDVFDVVRIQVGTSHRMVQSELKKLEKGEGRFDMIRALHKVDEITTVFGTNDTKVVVFVTASPILFNDELSGALSEFTKDGFVFFFVGVGSLASNSHFNALAGFGELIQVPNYWDLSSNEIVVETLTKRYGCNPCIPNPCAHAAQCHISGASYRCLCYPGYVGGVCATDPCNPNPCQPGQICRRTNGYHSCETASLCSSNPCHNNGVCDVVQGAVLCRCPSTHVGQHCEIRCPTCANGGVCRLRHGVADCQCPQGYFGKDCSDTTQYCRQSCSNGGYCENNPFGVDRCQCTPPFSGVSCTQTPCHSHQCQNGGQCALSEANEPYCVCPLQYRGEHCQDDPCSLTFCQNGGSCGVTSEGRSKCACSPLYIGEYCERSRCDFYYRCKNGGTCGLTTQNLVKCFCVPPFWGEDCSLVSPCPCQNGGTCVTDDRRQYCDCPSPYKGTKCETRDPCSLVNCGPRRRCIVNSQSSAGYTCECRPGYWGSSCLYNPCVPNPCENGGFCYSVTQQSRQSPFTFNCVCAPGYRGITCRDRMVVTISPKVGTTTTSSPNLQCLSNPCRAPCTCQPSCRHEQGYVCVSNNGHLGKNCDIPPSKLTCQEDLISLDVDLALLNELGGKSGLGQLYFAPDENYVPAKECEAKPSGLQQLTLSMSTPFTSCGTVTTANQEGDIMVTNKVWFNTGQTGVYDMATPVLDFRCIYKHNYEISTSLEPILSRVDLNNHEMERSGLKLNKPVSYELCKHVDGCVTSCPRHLLVQPGAVYTIGQEINVVIKATPDANLLGNELSVRKFYVSCGADNRTSPVINVVDDGCPTSAITSSISKNGSTTCVVFRVRRLTQCRVIYLHAKLVGCTASDLQACSSLAPHTRCPKSRRKRTPEKEEIFGPIYILPSHGDVIHVDSDQVKPKISDSSQHKLISVIVLSSAPILLLIAFVLISILCCSYCKSKF